MKKLMPHRSSWCAFTLIELVIALVITTLVLGSTAAILHATAGQRNRKDHRVAALMEAQAATRTITHALYNAHRPSTESNDDNNSAIFEGVDAQAVGLPADRIRFFTTSYQPVRIDQPESDIHECEFFLRRSENDTESQLYRRIDPTQNVQPDGGGVVERIAMGVVGLDIMYFDGATWRNEWPLEPPAWPIAVRITVMVSVKENRTRPIIVSRTVHFPYHNPPSSTSLPETDP